jgi:hypothetical protein
VGVVHRRALTIFEKTLGAEHRLVATTIANLALLSLEQIEEPLGK